MLKNILKVEKISSAQKFGYLTNCSIIPSFGATMDLPFLTASLEHLEIPDSDEDDMYVSVPLKSSFCQSDLITASFPAPTAPI